MKALVWGSGKIAYYFSNYEGLFAEYEIIGYVDNDKGKWGCLFNNKCIYSPEDIYLLEYDAVFIWTAACDEIKKQLKEMGIFDKVIITYSDQKKYLCKKVIDKYKNEDDMEIRKIVKSFADNGISIFGTYQLPNSTMKVYRDSDNSPYIWFEGKKMYFPRNYKFERENGEEIIGNVLAEQGEHSPHLYIKDESDIFENAIVVDAGACEGNFALRYIEKAKKIYIIEADPMWCEALEKTFANYSDKVKICNKYLSYYDSDITITLDTLVDEEIDFLKMDIEGAEIDALLGAKKTLLLSKARCSICSYHRQNDEENIRFILEGLGYKTETSEGYMFYFIDRKIGKSLDFRRGVVYGSKR